MVDSGHTQNRKATLTYIYIWIINLIYNYTILDLRKLTLRAYLLYLSFNNFEQVNKVLLFNLNAHIEYIIKHLKNIYMVS